MVTKTDRRTFSGLTAAFLSGPRAKQRVSYTVKAAQQRADEAWRRTAHGLHSSPLIKAPKA
ncbi:hypothetical protein GGD68_002637 [Paraburkholderia fungorum]|uniref:Uncharacterized protein n=1 Tax=Paraburkholderia fungorum TaxID=134537 RepID=A0AAW3UU40_9BURK|nr:hypothetical protein [Paraburkholderia fungorum]MBB6201117.1 hypothetical protein [Paraburkholderia fungorum]